jgi:hypothetical protein
VGWLPTKMISSVGEERPDQRRQFLSQGSPRSRRKITIRIHNLTRDPPISARCEAPLFRVFVGFSGEITAVVGLTTAQDKRLRGGSQPPQHLYRAPAPRWYPWRGVSLSPSSPLDIQPPHDLTVAANSSFHPMTVLLIWDDNSDQRGRSGPNPAIGATPCHVAASRIQNPT